MNLALPRSERARAALGVALIGLTTLVVYRAILFPTAAARYPWGSDTLGHVFRAAYLQQQIAAGSLLPALMPDWYLGLQLLRYYPPLPYYALLAVQAVTGDGLAAAQWFIALCALAGGLTWLLYRRWLGWAAIAGGVLFVFLPDNVRVALAEGNLPRVLATALLPLAFYWLLRLLDDGGRAHAVGLALTFAAIVLSHPMMAAIDAAVALLLCLLMGLVRASPPARLVTAAAGVLVGVGLAGWWLLPSLTGGLADLNSAAVTEALTTLPLRELLDPWRRVGNPEAVYAGAALLVVAAGALWTRPGRSGPTPALLVAGLLGVLVVTPGLSSLLRSLPLHSLLWPVRFLGVASFLLLLAVMWSAPSWAARSRPAAVLVVALLAADGAGSLFLIRLRAPQPDTAPISQALSGRPGWREATLDLSRLGAEPSYFYAAPAGREQIFGWAYQGASAARSVAALNEAVQAGFEPYLVDRLSLYGTDDVVLLRALEHAPAIASALSGAGFERLYAGQLTDLYHRDGRPRAALVASPALGIGHGAQNAAYLFPAMLVGTSPNVDDYAFETLSRYHTVFLSGFTWHHRAAAEALVKRVAEAGVNVVVDLTGVPEDPLARIPRFLGVWGESVILAAEPLTVEGPGARYSLQAPGQDDALWYTHTPQGLQTATLSVDYLGETATVAGYNGYGTGRVWFVGLNLPYHAALAQDAEAARLLADLLALPLAGAAPNTAVPLEDYQATRHGYWFRVDLERGGQLLVPVAYHAGMQVTVDGAPVAVQSFEQMVAFEAPAGAHQVELALRPSGIHWLGWLVTGLALAGLAGVWRWGVRS